MTGVYLLHFDDKIGNHAQHYLGFAEDVDARVAEHMAGRSRARLMEVCVERGVGFTLARVWEGGNRTLERHLKNQKHAWRHCPICRGNDLAKNGDCFKYSRHWLIC